MARNESRHSERATYNSSVPTGYAETVWPDPELIRELELADQLEELADLGVNVKSMTWQERVNKYFESIKPNVRLVKSSEWEKKVESSSDFSTTS